MSSLANGAAMGVVALVCHVVAVAVLHGVMVPTTVPMAATAGSSYPHASRKAESRVEPSLPTARRTGPPPTDAADLAAAAASAIPPARKPSAEREAAAADRALLNEQVNELKLLRGDVRQIVGLMKRWERWGPGP